MIRTISEKDESVVFIGRCADYVLKGRDTQIEVYYNYFTNKKWSEVGGYDLAINSADLGVDGSVDIILDYLEKKTNK